MSQTNPLGKIYQSIRNIGVFWNNQYNELCIVKHQYKKMTRKLITTILMFAISTSWVWSQPLLLSLDECRALAVKNNKNLKMADAEYQAAYYERKAAFTKYFPRINATGAYIRTEKEISLLSDDQKIALGNAGSALSSALPQMQPFEAQINAVGQGFVDGLRTDTRNMSALGVMLTQPIYMGGKIRAYNRIASNAQEIARQSREKEYQDLIVEVDEAYWRVVELQAKKSLAESYYSLVDTLHSNVKKMCVEGFATRADELSVKVKLNEAQVTSIQVDNGLAVSKMLLCQICGLDIDSDISLSDDIPQSCDLRQDVTDEIAAALSNRPELQSLTLATRIYDDKVKIARSEFLPTFALTGGYMATSPSVFNGFEKKLNGMWTIGVVANIPLVTSGERFYKVKAAKALALQSLLQQEEVTEKVELQVHQNHRKVSEAIERVNKAHTSEEQADENLRYAELGLSEGVIPVSNVIEAQTAWLAARTEAISSRIDLHLAKVYLNKSIGIIQ